MDLTRSNVGDRSLPGSCVERFAATLVLHSQLQYLSSPVGVVVADFCNHGGTWHLPKSPSGQWLPSENRNARHLGKIKT